MPLRLLLAAGKSGMARLIGFDDAMVSCRFFWRSETLVLLLDYIFEISSFCLCRFLEVRFGGVLEKNLSYKTTCNLSMLQPMLPTKLFESFLFEFAYYSLGGGGSDQLYRNGICHFLVCLSFLDRK